MSLGIVWNHVCWKKTHGFLVKVPVILPNIFYDIPVISRPIFAAQIYMFHIFSAAFYVPFLLPSWTSAHFCWSTRVDPPCLVKSQRAQTTPERFALHGVGVLSLREQLGVSHAAEPLQRPQFSWEQYGGFGTWESNGENPERTPGDFFVGLTIEKSGKSMGRTWENPGKDMGQNMGSWEKHGNIICRWRF